MDQPADTPNPPNANRAILMTAPGPAAIAVVRLVGPRVAEFLQRHFTRTPLTGRPVHAQLIDGDRILDDPLVLLTQGGQCADLNLHGGAWIVQSVLELARRYAFDVIEPLPIPLPPDAVDPLDPQDPFEIEMLQHLPLARTELALRILLAQPRAWNDYLARPEPRAPAPRQILDDSSLHHLLHTPHVAIVGAPNAGKSTLANHLFAQERSITADLPGTTRDWVGEIANIDGLPIMLVDTPGLHSTDDLIEHEAIQRSAEQVRCADLVLLVLDLARPLHPEQAQLLQQFPQALHILNKADQPHQWELPHNTGVQTIATTGAGVDELRSEIQRHFQCHQPDPRRPRCWTQRQRRLLQQIDPMRR